MVYHVINVTLHHGSLCFLQKLENVSPKSGKENQRLFYFVPQNLV